jgi:hypothetical protein
MDGQQAIVSIGLHSSTFEVSGLEPAAQDIITHVAQTVERHLTPFFHPEHPWGIALRSSIGPQSRRNVMAELAGAVEHNGPLVLRSRQERDRFVHEQVLLPLAHDLDLVVRAKDGLIRQCYASGRFNKIVTRSRTTRPPIEDVLLSVLDQIDRFTLNPDQYSTKASRIAALQESGLCRDERTVRLVEKEISPIRIQARAVNMVLAVLEAYGTYGPVGLLTFSSYRCTDELLLLERHVTDIEQLHHDSQWVIAELRRDIIALHGGMAQVHSKLWHQHLLHEPADSPARKRFEKRLWPAQRNRVVHAVAEERCCDNDTAEHLVDLLISNGLAGLIDWRCKLAEDTTHLSFVHQRALAVLLRLTVGMQPWAQDACHILLRHFMDALADVEVGLSVVPLLTEYPSSNRRKRWGRRLRFGLPSIQRRKHRRRHHYSRWKPRSPLSQTVVRTSRQEHSEHRFIIAFAVRARLTESQAENVLRNVLTYGVLGLLPRGIWQDALDPRITSWLRLIKYGRLDGTLEWSALYHQLSAYCEQLSSACPSTRVARAIFNSIAKPSYWHGGKGQAIDGGVRQRGTLSDASLPRLNALWLVIYFTLNVVLKSGDRKRYYVLLVSDEGAQLPVGGWLSETPPMSREVGLAIYQAIWHPGNVDYPLHGIPETIRIPSELVRDRTIDLHRAARHLMTKLDVVDKVSLEGKSHLVQMRDELRKQGPELIRSAADGDSVSLAVALQRIVWWLQARYFPNHRSAPVWHSIRRHGVALPGHDTPAAGWLLPAVGEICADDCGVTWRGNRYHCPWLRSTLASRMICREFPYFYPKLDAADPEPGIFVQMLGDDNNPPSYLNYSYS